MMHALNSDIRNNNSSYYWETLNRENVSPWLLLLAVIMMIPAVVQATIPQSERDALLALYNSTNGAIWNNNANWGGPAGTESTWYGVTTHAGNTTVVDLHLPANNLVGTLPLELRNLTNLELLELWTTSSAGVSRHSSATSATSCSCC